MTGYAWLGEAAGGQELIEKAQQAVAKEWTRRGPKTRLTQLFQEKFGAAGVDDLIEGITLERYNLEPADAPLVFQAAADGDQVALDLVLWAGRELGDLAVGVIRQLELADDVFEVILAGSFWKGSPLLIREFVSVVEKIAPGAKIERLNGPPVIGGVCIGMEAAGLGGDQIGEARRCLKEATTPVS
jgi:N-acetylglucosamine kinase-like BadF-type ATPase